MQQAISDNIPMRSKVYKSSKNIPFVCNLRHAHTEYIYDGALRAHSCIESAHRFYWHIHISLRAQCRANNERYTVSITNLYSQTSLHFVPPFRPLPFAGHWLLSIAARDSEIKSNRFSNIIRIKCYAHTVTATYRCRKTTESHFRISGYGTSLRKGKLMPKHIKYR